MVDVMAVSFCNSNTIMINLIIVKRFAIPPPPVIRELLERRVGELVFVGFWCRDRNEHHLYRDFVW